jgi:hypothetical protein
MLKLVVHTENVKMCVIDESEILYCLRPGYCFSGVYCHRLNSDDGPSMFLRNFNPQGYNVNAGRLQLKCDGTR